MPTPARVAVVPAGEGPLEVQEVLLPDPGPRQVVARIVASGVCHSQLHQIRASRQQPVVLGHEATAVVTAVGSEVSHVEEGDTVMVSWVPRAADKAGRHPEPASIVLADGSEALSQNVFTWADHTLADEQFVVRVDETIPRDVTAVIGCAVITGAGAVLHTARVARDESVAVFGVGGVGLCAVAAARHAGARPIIAVDVNEAKLHFAEKFGATATINASEADPVARIRELTTRSGAWDILGRPVCGVDHAFDCIGVETTMEQIIAAARSAHFGAAAGGTAVLVGVPALRPQLNALDILVNEKRFLGSLGGSCRPERDFPRFLRWYQQGTLDLDALVTARYALDEVNEVTAALEDGKIFGRAILEMQPEMR